MRDGTEQIQTIEQIPGPLELLCPGCGYDLRGTPGDRCGECGLVVDRASLQTSGFPWARRREIGRIPAYVRTLWMLSFRNKRLANETAKPQDRRDARAFARITSALLAIALLVPFALAALDDGSLRAFDIQTQLYPRNAFTVTPGAAAWDFTLPWSFGATLWPVLPIAIVWFALYVCGLPRSVLVNRQYTGARRECATALAYYASAPLVWLFLAALMLIITWQTGGGVLRRNPYAPQIQLLSACGQVIFAVLGIGRFFICVGQWAMRIAHGGAGAAMLALVQMLGLITFGALVLFGLLPWCVGFVRLVCRG